MPSSPGLNRYARVSECVVPAMMVLQFFVVLFFYPETKGISLEEMQKKLKIA